MKKRISQRDIARRLGVNVSSVSRALNGLPGVSEELRQKVKQLAEQQDYLPNPFAMSLRYDTTRTIGIIVPDISFNHYAHIVKWIETEAKKNGYMCIVTDSGDKYADEVEAVEQLLSKHVEGIAICLSQETNDYAHLERVIQRNIPVVLFDRTADIGCSTVSVNDVESGRRATLHLIDGGAQRIAFLGGPNKLKQTADRKHGYLEALRERGIPIRTELVRCGNVSFNAGLSETLDLFDLPEPPDAIIADHGLLAISVLQAVYSRGLRVPQDVSVIGFMSDWVSDISFPRMTFIKQNLKEIGNKTFKLLFDQINGNKIVKRIVVNARLNVKESTKSLIER
jgi:LacI family transcriptional regulator